MKKIDDKETTCDKKIARTSKNEETLNSLLTPQQKSNYLQSKDLIEQYKTFCEELVKQEQFYLQKIEDAKKMSKARGGSATRLRVFVPKNKNKDIKNRTKSSYKFGGKNEEIKSINKLIKNDDKKNNDDKGSTNIKKINANDI